MAIDKQLVCIGRVIGPHGVRGDAILQSFTENPETLLEFEQLLDDKGELFLTITSGKPHKAHFLVKTEPQRQREDWQELRGTELYIPRENLPELTEEDEFYIEDLVGLKALNKENEEIGHIHAVQNFGAGDLLEITLNETGKRFYLPFTQQAVSNVKISDGFIVLGDYEKHLPETKPLPTNHSGG